MKFKVCLEKIEDGMTYIYVNVKIKKKKISEIFGDKFLINLILDEKRNIIYLLDPKNDFKHPEQIDKLTELIQKKISKFISEDSINEWKISSYAYGENFEVFW